MSNENNPFTISEQQFIHGIKDAIKLDFEVRVKTMPEDIRYYIEKYGILTGGMSASYFEGNRPNDYDVYFNDSIDIQLLKSLIVENYIDMVSDVQSNYLETLVNGKFVTRSAITFKNGIQFIMMGNSNMRLAFDFIHCMPYYDCRAKTYHISKPQFKSLIGKKIKVNPVYVITNDKSHNKRIQKYINRGWTVE